MVIFNNNNWITVWAEDLNAAAAKRFHRDVAADVKENKRCWLSRHLSEAAQVIGDGDAGLDLT